MLWKVLNTCGKQKGLCTATAHELWVKAKLNFWILFCFSPYLISLNIIHAKLRFFSSSSPSLQVHRWRKKNTQQLWTVLPCSLAMPWTVALWLPSVTMGITLADLRPRDLGSSLPHLQLGNTTSYPKMWLCHEKVPRWCSRNAYLILFFLPSTTHTHTHTLTHTHTHTHRVLPIIKLHGPHI